jgi:hypothetical protein
LTNGSASKGVASVFGGSLKSATLSGGSIHREGIKPAGGSHLVTGRGSDTFAGGVKSAAKPVIHTIGSDTVVAGSSAFKKGELATKGGSAALSETIKVTGATAAGVKTAADAKSAVNSITMTDKTHISLTGVTAHNIIKPH